MANYSGKFAKAGKGFQKNNKSFSTETVPLGTFLHCAGDLLVLKLQQKDIPYPNSPVLVNKKQVGKIDEVLGPVTDVYASVKLEENQKVADFNSYTKFEAYKDKFINKERFLPREEVEKRKEINDKKKNDNRSRSFDNKKKSFDNKNKFDGNRKRSFGDKKSFDNKKSFGDKKNFDGNKKNFNKRK